MGTLDQVPYQVLEHLNALKRPRIALETCEEALSLYDFSFLTSFALLLGNEEYGLSYAALQAADVILKIPLHGSKNSLNIACAFALVAGEIRRQLD